MFCNSVVPTSIKLEQSHEGHEGAGGGVIYIQCHPEAELEHGRDTLILLTSTFSGSEQRTLVNVVSLSEEGWPFPSDSTVETAEVVPKLSPLSYDNNVRCNSCHPITGLVHVD